jgi:hypothetical protein
MKQAKEVQVPQINKHRARLIRIAAKAFKKWGSKASAIVWASLVLAMFRTKLIGSRFYKQSCKSESNIPEDMLKDMASRVRDSKCKALSDVCEAWELMYDKTISRD